MKTISLLLATFICLTPVAVLAQRADLPPEAQVVAILDNYPTVLAGGARITAAKAQDDMLRRGSHEVTIQGSYIRRTVDHEGGYDEFDTTIGRAFRLPGKASLDRKAGALGIEVAQNRAEDVRHQIALTLAGYWYDWLTADTLYRNDMETVTLLETSVQAVRRRRQLRDAADLDIDQASAALAQAKGQAATSLANREQARALLAATFPDLPLPAQPPILGVPELPQKPLAAMRDLVIERSHEIRAADREAQRLGVVSQRVYADRIADPTVGVRMFSERSGMERGAGLVVSMPFGGGYRRAAADQASAEANAARSELINVQRMVEATADTDLSNARARMDVWRNMADAAASALAAAARTQRGQMLGAIDLSDMLYARRQAHDAQRAEIEARAEAVRALTKLQIDSHSIWVTPGDS
ncbi:heavy metal efflux system protein [Novosphingobium sp. Rr 2-17]|uniref:TolC family protein n=1 Tax=Novosphingobium sp. Rr 2-17 TaxID=555793 RepID=UPI000269AB2C|nr:TolC family protein [Novosphingobium sp. Rr 2-17]EIZ79602.1 heavy metal efflux system protein [Novosphingobium sp. Rr 2-17]